MKTIIKNDVIKREKDDYASFLVKSDGWDYCSKSMWKDKVRGVKSKPENIETEDISENISDKKKRKLRKENKRKKYENKNGDI